MLSVLVVLIVACLTLCADCSVSYACAECAEECWVFKVLICTGRAEVLNNACWLAVKWIVVVVVLKYISCCADVMDVVVVIESSAFCLD